MMIWELTLYYDQEKLTPTTFHLICKYGLAKQRTKDLQEGAITIELKGNWTIGKGFSSNANAVVYNLISDNSAIALSFFQPDQNLLHLLDENKNLMIGTAGWSYTFNRKKPMPESSDKFAPTEAASLRITGDFDTVGIFGGRTPCNSALREIHAIPERNCQIIKCQLILLQNTKTHVPGNFLLQTIYVGNGDNNKYSITGQWKIMKGTVNDPSAIVYQLEPDPGKSNTPLLLLLLLKADNNILFFLDNDTHLLVGNDYCSYTLSRVRK